MSSNTISHMQDRREGGGGGVEGVNILCHKNLHFDENLSALKEYLQEPSTLITVNILQTKPSY